MWPLDRTAPGPDALYSSRHFLAESELKSARHAKADKFSFSRQGLKIRFLSYPIDC